MRKHDSMLRKTGYRERRLCLTSIKLRALSHVFSVQLQIDVMLLISGLPKWVLVILKSQSSWGPARSSKDIIF